MPLQQRFFYIPARDPGEAQEKYNQFLKTIVASEIRSEFVLDGKNSYWAISVEYAVDLKSKADSETWATSRVDYKKVLPDEDFQLYLKLKNWRKRVAAEEKCYVYNIFSNEQLAIISKKRIKTKAGLKEIKGIADAKAQRYGDAVIELVKAYEPGPSHEKGKAGDDGKAEEGAESGISENPEKDSPPKEQAQKDRKAKEEQSNPSAPLDMFDEKKR